MMLNFELRIYIHTARALTRSLLRTYMTVIFVVYTCRRLIDLSPVDAGWFVYTCRRLIDLSNDCRYFGDGAASEGDALTALNFASVYNSQVSKRDKFFENQNEKLRIKNVEHL